LKAVESKYLLNRSLNQTFFSFGRSKEKLHFSTNRLRSFSSPSTLSGLFVGFSTLAVLVCNTGKSYEQNLSFAKEWITFLSKKI
jgi:hypothetical protein